MSYQFRLPIRKTFSKQSPQNKRQFDSQTGAHFNYQDLCLKLCKIKKISSNHSIYYKDEEIMYGCSNMPSTKELNLPQSTINQPRPLLLYSKYNRANIFRRKYENQSMKEACHSRKSSIGLCEFAKNRGNDRKIYRSILRRSSVPFIEQCDDSVKRNCQIKLSIEYGDGNLLARAMHTKVKKI